MNAEGTVQSDTGEAQVSQVLVVELAGDITSRPVEMLRVGRSANTGVVSGVTIPADDLHRADHSTIGVQPVQQTRVNPDPPVAMASELTEGEELGTPSGCSAILVPHAVEKRCLCLGAGDSIGYKVDEGVTELEVGDCLLRLRSALAVCLDGPACFLEKLLDFGYCHVAYLSIGTESIEAMLHARPHIDPPLAHHDYR